MGLFSKHMCLKQQFKLLELIHDLLILLSHGQLSNQELRYPMGMFSSHVIKFSNSLKQTYAI